MNKLLLALALLALAAVNEPFHIDLQRGAAWQESKHGYDVDLPGYHLQGDIGTITLQTVAGTKPDHLTLAIKVPGRPPMLEGFTLTSPSGVVQTFLPNPNQNCAAPAADYFTLKVVGDNFYVIFHPKALALLKDKCTIQWVDCYR